jgi:hypothetical protein
MRALRNHQFSIRNLQAIANRSSPRWELLRIAIMTNDPADAIPYPKPPPTWAIALAFAIVFYSWGRLTGRQASP